jgi:hypothetical protein
MSAKQHEFAFQLLFEIRHTSLGSAGRQCETYPHGPSESSANDRADLIDFLKAVFFPTVFKRNSNIRAPFGISERDRDSDNPRHIVPLILEPTSRRAAQLGRSAFKHR